MCHRGAQRPKNRRSPGRILRRCLARIQRFRPFWNRFWTGHSIRGLNLGLFRIGTRFARIIRVMGPLTATRSSQPDSARSVDDTLPLPTCGRSGSVRCWSIRRFCKPRWRASRTMPFARSSASSAARGCWPPRWSTPKVSCGWTSTRPSIPIACGAWPTSRGRWPCRFGTTIRRRWPKSARGWPTNTGSASSISTSAARCATSCKRRTAVRICCASPSGWARSSSRWSRPARRRR